MLPFSEKEHQYRDLSQEARPSEGSEGAVSFPVAHISPKAPALSRQRRERVNGGMGHILTPGPVAQQCP